MTEPVVTITFEVSVLGLLVSAAALLALGLVVYYYRRMARQVQEIFERLAVPAAHAIDARYQYVMMDELAGLPPRAPRRVALTRRLRAGGMNL